MGLNNYNFVLPEENLALSPATPRDNSRLLVFDTVFGKITHDRFYNIAGHLPEKSFLVMNDTKVLPARVEMKKENGGKVTLLFLINEIASGLGHGSGGPVLVKAMADRKVTVGEKLFFGKSGSVKAVSQQEHIFTFVYEKSTEDLFGKIREFGSMPIPPYLRKTKMGRDELMEKYQTVFARHDGSSAAPTASLHFTDRVFASLEKKGIEWKFITLHVGLGTFAPLTEENLAGKKLHEEYYEIEGKTLQDIKESRNKGNNLVAVGTTVVRTLESLEKSKIHDLTSKIHGKTDLFIRPPYYFGMVDAMITNFHLPKSSLMMLVEAFLQHKGSNRHLTGIYGEAIREGYRFYSFGDVMLIK